ncbi:MAG: acetyl-CoA acetyltransferase [Nocardioidaceae bacterium]|nr:acetyl-CoA acetyltransferase [Nocardioidaceae bacterium]
MTPPPLPTISAVARTPIGTSGQAFGSVQAADLAAPVLARLAADLVASEVVLGNCTGPGGDLARVATLAAGLPVGTPALTVDRQCGSGLAAIEVAAALVAGSGRPVLAGGVESASTSDRPGRARFAPAPYDDPEMGEAADRLSEQEGIDRVAQDAYAARSHTRAYDAQQAGRFDAEIVPVGEVTRDERPRQGMTAARLARLPAAFRQGGTVTAGNSCGINDGAAAVSVVPGGPGLRILATASAGVDPALPGIGLVPAVRQALARADLGLDAMDVVELNEAFAGQVLACCRMLDLDPERVCPEGGALALGHPWGASGAVLAVRLFSQLMRPDGGRYGLAAIAVGGGQGVAMVVEACH